MSRLEVPRVGSLWENPRQPDHLFQVMMVVLDKHRQRVVFRWGPNIEHEGITDVKAFFNTYVERGQ